MVIVRTDVSDTIHTDVLDTIRSLNEHSKLYGKMFSEVQIGISKSLFESILPVALKSQMVAAQMSAWQTSFKDISPLKDLINMPLLSETLFLQGKLSVFKETMQRFSESARVSQAWKVDCLSSVSSVLSSITPPPVPTFAISPSASPLYGGYLTSALGRNTKRDIVKPIASGTKDEIDEWLYLLDPALYKMWQGAKQASASCKNLDRQRHVLISLRTLLDKLTERLAPDDDVRAWSTDPKYYRPDNYTKPSGKGCLSYICRHLLVSSFATFIQKDIAATIELWRYLNRVHELEPSISDTKLLILVERFELALLFLIRVSQVE